jgi:hypothetical protein
MHLDGLKDTIGSDRGFSVDTTFVLFFLGLEFGRTLQNLTFDAVLLLITMLMVTVLPYYLPSSYERPAFAKWIAGRALIAVLAIATGAILSQAYGTVLPESFRFLPLTLLILAAMSSCFIQFYALMRLRLAK